MNDEDLKETLIKQDALLLSIQQQVDTLKQRVLTLEDTQRTLRNNINCVNSKTSLRK